MGGPRAFILRYQPLDQPTRREATALVAEGFSVEVLCLADPGEPTHDHTGEYRVRRVKLNKRRGSALRYAYEYLAWFVIGSAWLIGKRLRGRIALVQVSTLPDTQVFAALVPKLTGAKIVVFLKEPTGELFETLFGSARIGRYMNRISDLAIRFSDQAFVVSEQHKQTYVDRGLPPGKLVPIVNAMPIDALEVTRSDRRPDPDRFVIICHGTIEERWGHETIVRAAAMARRDVPNLCLRFTGRGTYLEPMMTLVHDLDLSDAVEYCGYLSFPDLGQELMRAHVGVSAQKASPYSHLVQTGKMYEYLALGIPAIVTRLRSTAEYFRHGEVYFVEPDDPADMARAFVELAQDPALVEQLADEGARALEPYRWEAQEALYRKTIRRVIEGG